MRFSEKWTIYEPIGRSKVMHGDPNSIPVGFRAQEF
jgi:hypothetical protein